MSINIDSAEIVSTRAAVNLQSDQILQHEFHTYVFSAGELSRAAKCVDAGPKTDKTSLDDIKSNNEDSNEIDMRMARHDVIKMVARNQKIRNKNKMDVMRTIDLGAKPLKKTYKNYKQILEEHKRLKEIREKRRIFHQIGKCQTSLASLRKSSRKAKMRKHQNKSVLAPNISRGYGVLTLTNLNKNKKK